MHSHGISSRVCSHFIFVFWKGQYWLAHHQIFRNIGHSPIKVPLWTPSRKIQTNVLLYGQPFQFTYMGVELWANHKRWNWGAIENVRRNNLGTWGTLWERVENTLRTRAEPKNSLPPPLVKEKNWSPREGTLSLLIGCMKLLFPKLSVSIFGLG